MVDQTVIVIGGGLAGLAAGCYAQMNGYRSQILEHHAQPGGVAATWRRGEFVIDGGIHFVMGHKPGTGLHTLYHQVGIVPDTRFVDLMAYGQFVHEPSGTTVFVGADLDRLSADLKALAPRDHRIVDEVIDGARAMQGLDMSEMGLSAPPELARTWDRLREMWAIRRLLKYMTGRYAWPVARYVGDVQDPVLGAFLEALFLPSVPVYFVAMLLALLADGQLGLIEGGSAALVEAMERRYLALGGQVTYRATVREIVVDAQQGRAAGVRLADGREVRADYVISAADGYSTIFEMLGGRYTDEKIRKRYETWPLFRPLLLVSFGVAREFPDDPSFVTFVLDSPFAIGGEKIGGFFARIFNYSRSFAPPGKAVLQAEFETDWDYWHDLHETDLLGYEAEKQRVAAEVLQRLDAHYPGLGSLVEVTDVSTPYTTWRYTLNRRGAWGGWLMTPQTMTTTIERTLPGLAGLCLAGQWVMPGGGVPPCLYSGRHAVEILCRQDGKRFVTAPG